MDIEGLINQTFFGIDVRTMLGDVEDFIMFSESNIEWQKKRELRRAEVECEKEEFDDPQMKYQYTSQMLDNVEYRFDVSLTQRVRYSGITTLVTTVEWCLLYLKKRAIFEIKDKKYSPNDTINTLRAFANKENMNLDSKIELLQKLIHIRNCIVHAAGLIETYKYPEQLSKEIEDLIGISITRENFIGKSIKIEPGFLEKILKEIDVWLPELEKTAYAHKLLK